MSEREKRQWTFQIMSFGRRLDCNVVAEGCDEDEARLDARKYLVRGEYLGKVIPNLRSEPAGKETK